MKSGVLVFSVILLLASCSSESSYLEPGKVEIEDDTDSKQDSINIATNRWIYNQMSHHYFWNTEMPDSLSLDFTSDSFEFFNSLKSAQDRFSWCEINYNYNSRGENVNSTVSFDSVYTVSGKRIGYAVYDQFDTNSDVRSLAVKFKNAQVQELILDLRYNPGGYVSTCNDLASFIVPTKHLGKLFQQHKYNDILTRERMVAGGGNGVDSTYLHSTSWYKQWGLNLSRIVVLTTESTASASEALVMCLRPYMKVVTIGTTSCGKDVGSYTIADNRYKYQLQPITFRYYTALNDSTPVTGIEPDIYVEDDRMYKRGDTHEALLNAAIGYLLDEK